MRALLKSLTLLSTLFVLIACGGGGSVSRDGNDGDDGDGGGTPPEPTISISLSLADSDGNADSDLTIDNPLTLTATVTNSDGDAVGDTLVTFSLSNDSLASFSNDTGTARTNASGVATIGMTVGALAGDGAVTATIPSGEEGSTTFSSSGSGGGSVQPATLQLFASAVQLASSGSDDVELIALVKNEQSVLMEGVEVSFSVSNQADVELQLTQPTTTADGTARARLTTLNNATNRVVTVTAQTGTFVETVDIEIFGTDVTINGTTEGGTASVILNDSVDLTLRVQDSDGVAVPNQSIQLAVDNGLLDDISTEADEASATLTVTTSANGQASVKYTGTVSGTDTLTAAALGDAYGDADGDGFKIFVQEDEFFFSSIPAGDTPLNTQETLTVSWRKDGSPFADGDVTFSASRGTIVDGQATGTTNADGEASFTISSTNAGKSSITATGIDDEGNEVSARVDIEFVATVPHVMQADATPDLIGPDGQTSTITAIVRDVDGNLVKNTVVNFNVDDTSTGTISPSQSTTDSNGVASTVFTSGSVTSEDAVVVTAAVSGMSEVSDTVTLTVGNRAFDVSIGTGNVVLSPDNATYLKEFAVFVTDSVGQPVEGVSLTASTTPTKFANNGMYRKGFWIWNGTVWVITNNDVDPVRTGLTAECTNEDINADGILNAGEDNNNDGFLTPGIVGALSFAGGNVTDENGQATLELRYPKAYAPWYDTEITVFAQSTGSEASASTIFTLSAAASDLDDEAEQPPPSPFGVSDSCNDIF
ncbi:Ig-like domain-containing protein [Alteromonas sp. ASW11-19]|uniref:Ig-like domain-containing protein n=1 Tax=Alteromonas salexigens TaxID=2982530 RepID=A0ABT2VKX0_9ALTE|nr:Ig-like domain-containing protein [Alteromonas salexigens]MCU7553947.1 Ig-like domain-containing protein [Alteromonas salexigens]